MAKKKVTKKVEVKIEETLEVKVEETPEVKVEKLYLGDHPVTGEKLYK